MSASDEPRQSDNTLATKYCRVCRNPVLLRTQYGTCSDKTCTAKAVASDAPREELPTLRSLWGKFPDATRGDDEPRTDEEYIARLRVPLLHYFGTTDPDLLADVWKEQARAADERKASDGPSGLDLDAIEARATQAVRIQEGRLATRGAHKEAVIDRALADIPKLTQALRLKAGGA